MRELANWRLESAFTHAINISNTPLAARPAQDPIGISQLLVCHDFKGGYHPSEAAQGQVFLDASNGGPKHPIPYTLEFLPYVTTFVYFTHKRVTIPPAPWINVCHRAGVRVLGSLMFEGNNDTSEAGRLFEEGSEGEFIYATQLTAIAETYGFDGWLLNFESTFPLTSWSPIALERFLYELRSGLSPHKSVVFYDSLTVLNTINYQNALTSLNAPWLMASDKLFVNYWWRELQLGETAFKASIMGRARDVLMGVDCYGRGTMGNGGFNVGIPLQLINRYGLSVALFAPGWTYENFDGRAFHTLDRRFWMGEGLGEGVASCVDTHPAGTTKFFYTNFNRGYGSSWWLRGEKISSIPWIHLGAQSLLPIPIPTYESTTPPFQWSLDDIHAFTGGWSLKSSFSPHLATSTTAATSASSETYYSTVFSLAITYMPLLVLRYAALVPTAVSGEAGLYWDFLSSSSTDSNRRVRRFVALEKSSASDSGWVTGEVLAADEDMEGHILVEVGVYYKTPSPFLSQPPITDFWIGEIVIKPLDTDTDDSQIIITNIITGGLSLSHKPKVQWSIYNSMPPSHHDMWSEITKEFSYFLVWDDTKMIGIAFACEFVVGISSEGGEDQGGENHEVDLEGLWVCGVSWDGRVIKGRRRHDPPSSGPGKKLM